MQTKMKIKELIKEVEELKVSMQEDIDLGGIVAEEKFKSIKQTVEAVDDFLNTFELSSKGEDNVVKGIGLLDDWQTLKKLLGIK